MGVTVLAFDDIRQDFPTPARTGKIRVLDGISFDVGSGKFVAVIGPSGCGKSTLLQMAAGLLPRHAASSAIAEKPSPPSIAMSASCRSRHNCFPGKPLSENVELPLLLRGVAPAERRERVAKALEAVGLSGFEQYFFRASSPVACRSADRSPAPWCADRTSS